MSKRSIGERFWIKVDKTGDDGCWLWTGATFAGGYGMFWRNGRASYAHRVAYELIVGPIPIGLQLDHLCRVRHCVNPAHLEPVTPQENALRGVGPAAMNAAKTHCIHGHEFTEDNTYPNGPGGRGCRECRIEASRRFRERQHV